MHPLSQLSKTQFWLGLDFLRGLTFWFSLVSTDNDNNNYNV